MPQLKLEDFNTNPIRKAVILLLVTIVLGRFSYTCWEKNKFADELRSIKNSLLSLRNTVEAIDSVYDICYKEVTTWSGGVINNTERAMEINETPKG